MSESSSAIRYVVFHLPGPAWQPGVDFREQLQVSDHVTHYATLHSEGKLELGGPFLAQHMGGMMVTRKNVSLEEIETFAAADPAVQSGLLKFEIRPWSTPFEHETHNQSQAGAISGQ